MCQLCQRTTEKVNEKPLFFWSHHASPNGRITKSCLSQWWPCTFSEGEHSFCCAEQYMMLHKALLCGDKATSARILDSHDPRVIKALGRQISPYNPVLWEQHRQQVVYLGNLLKFSQNPPLRYYLCSTGQRLLAEASPYDAIWGIGLSAKEAAVCAPEDWPGQNLLGQSLMAVRSALSHTYREEEIS